MDDHKNRLSPIEIVGKMRDAAGGMIPLANALSPFPITRGPARNLYNSLCNSANAGHLPPRRQEEILAFCHVHKIPCDKDHFVSVVERERLEKLRAEMDGAAA